MESPHGNDGRMGFVRRNSSERICEFIRGVCSTFIDALASDYFRKHGSSRDRHTAARCIEARLGDEATLKSQVKRNARTVIECGRMAYGMRGWQ